MKSFVKGSRSSRSKSRGKVRVQCFYCKDFGHLNMNYLECANNSKGDNPCLVVVVA